MRDAPSFINSRTISFAHVYDGDNTHIWHVDRFLFWSIFYVLHVFSVRCERAVRIVSTDSTSWVHFFDNSSVLRIMHTNYQGKTIPWQLNRQEKMKWIASELNWFASSVISADWVNIDENGLFFLLCSKHLFIHPKFIGELCVFSSVICVYCLQ